MNAWTICLCLILIAAPFVSSNKTRHAEDILKRQLEILGLYEGFCCNDTNDIPRGDFPIDDAHHFSNPHVLGEFLEAYEDGFIDKESYFTLYTYKNRQDTFRLFDVLYFAKDFKTFLKIAKWAKRELNHLQYAYALTASIYRRNDTKELQIPTFYEVFPQYFTPEHVMNEIDKSMICGIKERKFIVNDTGSEYSFYKDQTFDYYRYGFKYNEFDSDSKVAYFREDVGLRNWYTKLDMYLAPWVSGDKYPCIKWKRRGEFKQMITSYMLKRYNLERASNGLPLTEPIVFRKPIKSGYNSHLTDFRGRALLHRPDNFNAYDSNPRGVAYTESLYDRYLAQVEAQHMYIPTNSTYMCIKGIEGSEKFLNIFYGITEPDIRSYYRPLYYLAMDALDNAVSAGNDIVYTGSTFSNYLTEPVDHTFYQVLAWLETIYRAYDARKKPYTKKDIELPGVTITNVDFTRHETFFEKYEYNISNVCPGQNGKRYNYTISRCRLNHKPYSYRVEIQSTKQMAVSVKMMMAPKCDSGARPLGWTAFTQNAVSFDVQHVDVNPGCNTVKRKSTNDPNRKEPATFNDIENILAGGNPFFAGNYEPYPANLAIPRGSKTGKVFQVMFIAQPRVDNIYDSEFSDPEIIQKYDTQKFMRFPFDRPIAKSVLNVSNVYFTELPIYDFSEHCTNECLTA